MPFSRQIKSPDELWMKKALYLAQKGIGLTSPNPCVGAVLVKQGKEIGKGYHQKAGEKHAEILAIENASQRKKSPKGSTLYLTLEPCSTFGKTPPCVTAIIKAGVKRVVVGATDPNPRHAGRAYRKLRQHGIQVVHGVLAEQCQELNRAFNHWITTQRPWVIAKIAMSLDGRISPHPSQASKRITSPASIQRAHYYRLKSDAIMVGAETVRSDNPRLTVRLGALSKNKKQPWRVIVTRSGKLPRKAHLLIDSFRQRTLIFQNKSLTQVLKELGKKEVTCVLLEGGGKLLASAFEANLVDEIAFFIAPKFLGGSSLALLTSNYLGENGVALKDFTCEKIDSDLLLKGYVHRTR